MRKMILFSKLICIYEHFRDGRVREHVQVEGIVQEEYMIVTGLGTLRSRNTC